MNNQNLYIDIHAIQTVPPSNLNRDDTGSPKTAQYGGVTRARVSSQCWKKAVRQYFSDQKLDEKYNGKRSLDIVDLIAKTVVELEPATSYNEAIEMVNETLKLAKVTTKDNRVKALFFISPMQAKAFAQAAIDKIEDKKKLQEILNANPSVDIALFGRMVADDPTLNEDASCQVAHAISTHSIETEFDFFTATDDLAPEDNAGAGMLGTMEFNSSTLYRYANIAAHELANQLQDKEMMMEALKHFIEAFLKSMPTGKINSFANQTLPEAVMIAIRKDRPVNLVTAFESPIKASDGYVGGSIIKLREEYHKVMRYVEEPLAVFSIGIEGMEGQVENLKSLLDQFGKVIDASIE